LRGLPLEARRLGLWPLLVLARASALARRLSAIARRIVLLVVGLFRGRLLARLDLGGRGRSRRRCARRASARSAPRAFCRADGPARTPRRRERTWLPRALASVASNQGCAAATCRRRVVRSRRKWWECPASPWRRRPWRVRGDPRAGGRGRAAARERRLRGRSRRGS